MALYLVDFEHRNEMGEFMKKVRR